MSRADEFFAAAQRHGAQGAVDRVFHDEAPITTVPWDQMGRRRDRGDYDRELVADELRKPASEVSLSSVDPRNLHATQPMITRGGVSHYMGPEYAQTGRTFADHEMVGNVHPVVYRRPSLTGGEPQNLILSGHHRAAAALLQGNQFHARVIEGPWGPMRGSEPATPSLERQRPKLRSIRPGVE